MSRNPFTTEWLNRQLVMRSGNRGEVQSNGLAKGSKESPERELHRQILDECRKRGWIALHGSMVHRAMRNIGEWDFTIVADAGRVFFIEAKTRTGKLTTEQAALHAWARRLGHQVHV